jgi:hypothetical protein
MPGEGTEQIKVLAALDPSECRTTGHLAELTGLTNRQIVSCTAKLIDRGFAERAERGCFTGTQAGLDFLLSGEPIKSGPRGHLTGRHRRPKRRTIQDRIWAALRIRQKASVPELIELAATEGAAPTVSHIQRYLKALVGAGYLRELPRREPGTAQTSNGFKRYQLLRDTGPIAPRYSGKTRSVIDANTDEVISTEVVK